MHPKSIEVFNRVEHKFMINRETYLKLREMLDGYVYEDGFSTNGGFYTICNIYYDTATDELIRKSLEKPIYKEKMRLRSYGQANSYSKVFLEIKKKYNGVVNKRRTTLQLNEADEFIKTYKHPPIKEYMNAQVLNEIEYFMNFYKPVPKVYIAYDRSALFCKDDPELRITFDTNIRTRRDELRLDSKIYGDQLLEDGCWLMEIKVHGAYPLWLVEILNKCGVQKNSFSKYGTEYKNYLKYNDNKVI